MAHGENDEYVTGSRSTDFVGVWGSPHETIPIVENTNTILMYTVGIKLHHFSIFYMDTIFNVDICDLY